jgi:hypothetical protein
MREKKSPLNIMLVVIASSWLMVFSLCAIDTKARYITFCVCSREIVGVSHPNSPEENLSTREAQFVALEKHCRG